MEHPFSVQKEPLVRESNGSNLHLKGVYQRKSVESCADLCAKRPYSCEPSPLSSCSSDSTTGASADTRSPSRRRITITPCVERPIRRMSSTDILITVPPVEISIT